MAETPWMGDACSLVDAFRSGERSPTEELEATRVAVEASAVNAFTYLDWDAAFDAAANADTSLAFGGVPFPIKSLTPVAGWPDNECSVALDGRIAEQDATIVSRLRTAGPVLYGQTNASEFGGLAVGINKLYGTTRNPWDISRTPGGSSGGSAAAVAAGLCPIALGGDGGGSIRKPAAYCGLLGFKSTFGAFPRGPNLKPSASTVTLGVLARSVRDAARFLDVCQGNDERDPYTWPRQEGWERDLGTQDLSGLRVAIDPTLGGSVTLRDAVHTVVQQEAEALAKVAGWDIVDVEVSFPSLSLAWAAIGLAEVRAVLGDLWPGCKDQLTYEIATGLDLVQMGMSFDALAMTEIDRMNGFESMAAIFDQVDLLITATNPDIAPPAETVLMVEIEGKNVDIGNDAGLTVPANIAGNPATSIPAGNIDGLPVGLQVVARHHADRLLLDVALLAERERSWPLVAPGAPV